MAWDVTEMREGRVRRAGVLDSRSSIRGTWGEEYRSDSLEQSAFDRDDVHWLVFCAARFGRLFLRCTGTGGC